MASEEDLLRGYGVEPSEAAAAVCRVSPKGKRNLPFPDPGPRSSGYALCPVKSGCLTMTPGGRVCYFHRKGER